MATTIHSELDLPQNILSITDKKYELFSNQAKTNLQDLIQQILSQDEIDLIELKKTSWQGVECPVIRARIWRLILGYESPVRENRSEDLQKKRLNYLEQLGELNIKHKISKKFIASLPKYELFKSKVVQNSLMQLIALVSKDEKLRKKSTPAIIIPFFIVFLSEFYPIDLETLEVHDEGPQRFYASIVEADTYWCCTIFLKNYLECKKNKLCESVLKALEKFDLDILSHLNSEGIKMSFLNRWVKYLFLKDFPLNICMRIFDELITNKSPKMFLAKCNKDLSQKNFIVCLVCALFSIFRSQILNSRGTQLEITLSKLPTDSWGEIEILILVSQAYLYQSILD